MILEYLIENEENADKAISVVADSGIAALKKKLTDEHFIVTVVMKGESEMAAKKLSDIDDSIMNISSPTVLSNGPAAYFKRRTF